MVVEASTGTRKGGHQRTKIFVGNVHKDTKLEELSGLFEVYGAVVESDILTNYAFVVGYQFNFFGSICSLSVNNLREYIHFCFNS